MKIIKSIISLLLVCVLTLSGFTLFANAHNDTVTVKMANFNVGGLPKFSKVGRDNQKCISEFLNSNDYDIVAVQEDFTYHNTLIKGLTNYNYFTNHSGTIPGGDGMNIFTRNMPIYNEKRVQWDDAFGEIIEGDLLTPKGLMHTVIDIGDGIYIDFYNLHADAFDSAGSRTARRSNYNQIANLIEYNYEKYNRPVIVTGDFNHFLHTSPEINSDMYEIFHTHCNLKDAWVETNNNGDYFDFSKWSQSGVSYWGNWDSVEKFLYKDGGGVKIQPLNYKYIWVKNETGENTSDHALAECTFSFIKTESFVENTQELEVVKQSFFRNIYNTTLWIFKDLIYILSHFDELLSMLG